MKLTVNDINVRAANAAEFIAECEKAYHGEVLSIAEEISSNPENKIIMIAGPSGSGKTTTAHILRDYLFALKKPTQVVSLDDFYLDRVNAPLDEEGKPDFETVHSLDIEEINRCFAEVLEKNESLMPLYDFKAGTRSGERKSVSIKNGGLLIVEGLHALNPLLSEKLPSANIFKLYISPNRAIYNDDGTVALSSRQIRLARRMSRDAIYRGSSAQQTFDMWESVIKGEKKYLYCFKPTADRLLSTLHPYEPCIFKNNVLRLLSEISPQSEDYDYVVRTANSLERFIPLSEECVPQDSLIREFIRGGKYE